MDTMHPSIVDAIMAHEQMGSGEFVQEAIETMDINEMCQSFRSDINRVGFLLARRNLKHQHMLAIGKINHEQYSKLQNILREGIDDEREGPILVQFPGLHSRLSPAS